MPSLPGCKSDFTILDTDDVVRLIKQLIQAEGLDDKRWPAKQFAQMIDGWKNKGLGPADIPEGDARAFANGKGRELYKAYQERLQTLNACDFGDLLCHPIRIFRANPDVLKEYHKRFKYILVDEYQDTNTAQYMWLRLLAQRPQCRPPLRGRCPRSGRRGSPQKAASHRTVASSTAAQDPTRPGFARPPSPQGGAETREPGHRKHLLRRRRRPVDLWLARRRGRQHPALRQGFSRRHHHPAGAQLPLHRAHPRHRLPSHRPQ